MPALDTISIGIYMDAVAHPDFWERLASYVLVNGWPEPGHVINLYPEIRRDERGWECLSS